MHDFILFAHNLKSRVQKLMKIYFQKKNKITKIEFSSGVTWRGSTSCGTVGGGEDKNENLRLTEKVAVTKKIGQLH